MDVPVLRYIQALLEDFDGKSMATLVNLINIASDDLVQLLDSRQGYNGENFNFEVYYLSHLIIIEYLVEG